MQSQPPSTARLMPLIASFSSRKRDASTTSAIVTRRPIGVRWTSACSRSGRHVAPLRAVADDRWMQRVHTRRRELDHERPHEARHSAVDGRDGCRARIRSVTREAAEDEDCRVIVKARGQRVDHLGVADELERDEPQRGRRCRTRARCSRHARSPRGRGTRLRRRRRDGPRSRSGSARSKPIPRVEPPISAAQPPHAPGPGRSRPRRGRCRRTTARPRGRALACRRRRRRSLPAIALSFRAEPREGRPRDRDRAPEECD